MAIAYEIAADPGYDGWQSEQQVFSMIFFIRKHDQERVQMKH